ncbi:hypothetical protein TrST_g2664 [Triparma strigata]|uniref:Uncharacterized protein n=1 Tax=Triparma strigata TaxID=1606541 RepID=A0A9W7BK30_9STRA|nr:hypothetical protein TrST_g2664 [Triparma strigata]
MSKWLHGIFPAPKTTKSTLSLPSDFLRLHQGDVETATKPVSATDSISGEIPSSNNPSGSEDLGVIDNRMSVKVQNDKNPEQLLATLCEDFGSEEQSDGYTISYSISRNSEQLLTALSQVTDAKTLKSCKDQLSLVGDEILSYVGELSEKVDKVIKKKVKGARKDKDDVDDEASLPGILPLASTSFADQLSLGGGAMTSYAVQLSEKVEGAMKDEEQQPSPPPIRRVSRTTSSPLHPSG